MKRPMPYPVTMGQTTIRTPIPITPVGGTTPTSLGETTSLNKAKEVGNHNSKTFKAISTVGMGTGNFNRTIQTPETKEREVTNRVAQPNRRNPILRQ